jgi:hypothetical protein
MPRVCPVAIYHLTTKPIKRSDGRSAVAAAAYRSAERLLDETTGLVHDYTRRREYVEGWIQAPDGAPAWARDRGELWNRVEANERRKNSRVAREVEVALPVELSRIEQDELVRGFVRERFVSRGIAADVNVHRGDANNPHAHVMLTTREVGPEDFGNKDRGQDRKEVLKGWREAWEEHANRALARAGREERVSCRSYAALGIDREPTVHEGAAVREMEERGYRTARGGRNRAVRRRNLERERERGRGERDGKTGAPRKDRFGNGGASLQSFPEGERKPDRSWGRKGGRSR